MEQADFMKFSTAWIDANENAANKSTPSERNVSYAFELLIDFPVDVVVAAIKQHSKTQKFAPTVADIHELLNIGNKRPTSDEAWLMIPKDEFVSAWLTDEMLAAWTAGACDMYSTDKVGARMGYKSVYERLCTESELQGKLINWNFSAGYDEHQRREKLIEGHKKGWISKERMATTLPSRTSSTDFGLMITGKEPVSDKIKVRFDFSGLTKMLDESDRLEAEEKRRAREEAEMKKNEIIAKAQSHLNNQPPQEGQENECR